MQSSTCKQTHLVVDVSEVFRSAEGCPAQVSKDVQQSRKEAVQCPTVDERIVSLKIAERLVQPIRSRFEDAPFVLASSQIHRDAQSEFERHVESRHTHGSRELYARQIVN